MMEKEKMELELNLLRETVSLLSQKIETIDRQLEPVRLARWDIEAQIRLTHECDERGVIVLDLARKDERAGMFQRLSYISEHHGRAFAERSDLARRVKACQREMQRLEREIERKKPKRGTLL